MISLAPIKDKNQIKEWFSKNSLEANENSGCVSALCGEEVLGYCLYNLANDKITIYKIEPAADLMLADGLLRSTLHVAAERSVMNAFYEGEEIETLCEKLAFIKEKAEKSLDIDKLFKSCQSCK